MSRPLLPTRDVSALTRMINPLLPPPAIPEIQLHGLAWGGMVTPPLRMQELAALTGKRQVMFIRHMSQLRHILAFSWRSTGPGTIIVTFTFEPSEKSSPIPSPLLFPDSKILESQNHPSLSLKKINLLIIHIDQENIKQKELKEKGIKKELLRRGRFQIPGIWNIFQKSGIDRP